MNTFQEDENFGKESSSRNTFESPNIGWDSSKVEEAWMQVISKLRESRRVLFDNLTTDFSQSNEIKLLINSSDGNPQFLSIIEEELTSLTEKLKEIIPWNTKITLEKNVDTEIKNKKSYSNISIENDGKDMIQEVVDLFDGKVVDIKAHEKPL